MRDLLRAPEGAGVALVEMPRGPMAPPGSAELRRLQAEFRGVYAYVALFLDVSTGATVLRGLTPLYGKSRASSVEIGKLALAELGVMGPERYEFLCALAIGEDTIDGPESNGFKVVVKQHSFLRMVNKQQLVTAYEGNKPSDAQIKAERETKSRLSKMAKYVGVFVDDETLDVWCQVLPVDAPPNFDLQPLQRACLFALGQYDVAKTTLLAAIKVGSGSVDGVEVRLWHDSLAA